MHTLFVAARNPQLRLNRVIEGAVRVFKYLINKRNSELTQSVRYRTQQVRSPLFVPVNKSSQQSYPQACGELRNLKINPQLSGDCDVLL
jgi:hypothetical protein